MAVQNGKLRKNIEGFVDHQGIFHPIRNGEKEGGFRYSRQKAGDNDDIFDREIRKANNQKKAEEIWERRMIDDALQTALGEERKVSLSQFVRKNGGILYNQKSNDPYNGEIENLSFKQSKVKGLAHQKGKYSLDGMRESADLAGYASLDGSPLSTINDFLDALQSDMKGKPIYPFGTIGSYKFNPGRFNKTEYLRKQYLHISRVIRKLEKRKGSKTKIAKLKNVSELISKLANHKKPTKENLKKNGLLTWLSMFADAAVGTSAAVGLYDRFKTKAPINKKRVQQGGITLQDNPKKKPLKKNKGVEISPERQKQIHQSNFEKFLVAIENGDLSKQELAKIQGKLAGHPANDVARAIQYARLTYKLKRNPSPANIKAAQNAILKENGRLKTNGIIGRALARHKAGREYKRQLRLEAAIDRAKKRRTDAEAKAKKNPAKIESQSYEAFQGRKPTKQFEIESPDDAPKHLYALGKLLELRLRGKQNINFRREITGKTFYLCADENNKQLWIVGGTVAEPNNQLKQGYSEQYARITHVVYETKKVHLDDTKTTGYIHKFGEDGGEEPTLAFDGKGFPIIVGGTYEITPLGIAD